MVVVDFYGCRRTRGSPLPVCWLGCQGPSLPTTSSSALDGATWIWLSLCTTIRATARSTCSVMRPANVAVGLDVIRASGDHGTAFDIAGKGIVDERSLLESLRQGTELATRVPDTRLKYILGQGVATQSRSDTLH